MVLDGLYELPESFYLVGGVPFQNEFETVSLEAAARTFVSGAVSPVHQALATSSVVSAEGAPGMAFGRNFRAASLFLALVNPFFYAFALAAVLPVHTLFSTTFVVPGESTPRSIRRSDFGTT